MLLKKWPNAIDLLVFFLAAEQKSSFFSFSSSSSSFSFPSGTQYLHPSACLPASLSSTAGFIAAWSAGGDGGADERQNETAGASDVP